MGEINGKKRTNTVNTLADFTFVDHMRRSCSEYVLYPADWNESSD